MGIFISSYNHAQDINCTENQDCYVSCLDGSCFGITINCPQNGGCYVTCDGDNACHGATIIWVDGQPNSLSCGTNGVRSCMALNSIKPYKQDQDFTFDCTRAP